MNALIFLSIVTLCVGAFQTSDEHPKTDVNQKEFTFPEEKPTDEGRTFGIAGRRRMQMIFLPIMFKLGVILTLLVGLTVLMFKTLAIGVILLVIAFSGLFSKIKVEKHGYHHAEPVQVHLHGVSPHHHYPEHISDWSRTGPFLRS